MGKGAENSAMAKADKPSEQSLDLPADARADQFSYCVALFEALTKSRPYRFEDLRKDPDHADIVGWEGIPRTWRQPLRRGLALRPAERWPSMDALLHALEVGRARARRAPSTLSSWTILSNL